MSMFATQSLSTQSLWWSSAEPVPQWQTLNAPLDTDVCIVGAGFTGLTTALKLTQDHGVRVAVLEAFEPGWLASSRNAGFVVPNIAAVDPDGMCDLLGEERGRRLALALGDASDGLFDTVRALSIKCDAVKTGWIQPAPYPAMINTVANRFEQWQALGQPVEWLNAAALETLTGTDTFCEGWINHSGGSIQPVSYLRGIAHGVSRSGGDIYANVTVERIERKNRRWSIDTTAFPVTADKLLLCTNVTTPELCRQATTLPLRIYQMATSPLAAVDAARLSPARQPVSDVRADIFTYRLDAQHRLITGGMPATPIDNAAHMAQRMVRRLAQELRLQQVPQVEALWSGVAAVTADYLPAIHDLGPGAYAGLACNGRGIAATHVLANDLVDLTIHSDAARSRTGIPIRVNSPPLMHREPLRRLASLATRAWLWRGRQRDRQHARRAVC